MKKFLLVLWCLIASVFCMAQSVLPLRADTVRIEKVGGSGELQIRNATRDSIGVMVNIGGGRTRFMKVKKSGDTAIIIGLDTISITGKVTLQQAINNGNILNKHDTILNPIQLDILGVETPNGRVGAKFMGIDGSLEMVGNGGESFNALIKFRDLTNPSQNSQIGSLDGSNIEAGSFPDPALGQAHFRAAPTASELTHSLFPKVSSIRVNKDSTIIDPGPSSLLGLLIRNLPAGGTADDSVLMITSQDQVKRRAASSFGGAGIDRVGVLNSQPKNEKGASINGDSISLQSVNANNPGIWSTGKDTVPGGKTFLDAMTNFQGYNPRTNAPYIPTDVVAPTINTGNYNAFGITFFFPASGKIGIAYREGGSHAGDKGIIKMRTSIDQGRTWSSATTIYSDGNPNFDVRNIGGGVTPSGRLIIFCATYDFTIPATVELFYMYSDDEGLTWSPVQTVPHGLNTFFSPYGGLTAPAKDTLALTWYGHNGTTFNSYLIRSYDNGVTWQPPITILTGNTATTQYTETSVAYLGGSAMLAIARNNGFGQHRQAISNNNGLTWVDQGNVTFDTVVTGASRESPVWLSTFMAPNGRRAVACYYSNRTPKKMRAVYGYASDLVNGVSGWQTNTRIDFGNMDGTYGGYPSVVHPFDQPSGVGWWYDDDGTQTDANIVFFTAPFNSAVPINTTFRGNVSFGANLNPSVQVDISNTPQLINPVARFQNTTVTIPSYSAVGFQPALTNNTIAQLAGNSSTAGGLQLNGFSSNSPSALAVQIRGIQGSTVPTAANTLFVATKHNGTNNFASLGLNETAFQFRNNASNLMTIMGSGNIGIGTATPGADIDIFRTGTQLPQIRLQDGDNAVPSYAGAPFNVIPTTNTVGVITTSSFGNMGMSFSGFGPTTTSRGASIVGYSGKTAVDTSVVTIIARKWNGTNNYTDLTGAEPMLAISNDDTTTKALFRANGNLSINTISTDANIISRMLYVNGSMGLQPDSIITVTPSTELMMVLNPTTGRVHKATIPGGSGSGDIVGPSSATDNAIARFDGITGKLLQNSSATLDDLGNINTSGSVTVANASVFSWAGRSWLRSFADGNITLSNTLGDDFNMLQFGGFVTGYPALKRSGAGLVVRDAADGVDAPLTASTLTQSGLSGTGTRLSTVTSSGVGGAIANGADGQIMTMVAGSPAWANNSGNVTSTTYTPTLTSVTNLDAVSSVSLGYYVTGTNILEPAITIYGEVTIDPTVAGQVQFRISLPSGWASAFINVGDAAGTAADDNAESFRIKADTVNDQLLVSGTAANLASHTISIHATYRMIFP